MGNPRNFGQWEQREATFMLHSTAHWQKTVHGYSGFRSERLQALFTELAEFPSEQSLQHLTTSASPTSWSTRISFRPATGRSSSSESPGSADG